MRGPLILHQTVMYEDDEPYILLSAAREGANRIYAGNSHWHEELELIYVLSGHVTYYAEGSCIHAEPGRLLVTNCESIHRVIAESGPEKTEGKTATDGESAPLESGEDRFATAPGGVSAPPGTSAVGAATTGAGAESDAVAENTPAKGAGAAPGENGASSPARKEGEGEEPAVLVLLIPRRFLDEQFPEYKRLWFLNEKPQARWEIREIMLRLAEHRRAGDGGPFGALHAKGLLLLLLSYLCEEGVVSRPERLPGEEDACRLKNILRFVETHFREPLSQAEVAAKFYFTPQYFARYFKRCTGVTFTEHLTGRRITQAKKELLHTDKLIGDIALDNGFPDERSFINAFKKLYQLTPVQYRKSAAFVPR